MTQKDLKQKELIEYFYINIRSSKNPWKEFPFRKIKLEFSKIHPVDLMFYLDQLYNESLIDKRWYPHKNDHIFLVKLKGVLIWEEKYSTVDDYYGNLMYNMLKLLRDVELEKVKLFPGRGQQWGILPPDDFFKITQITTAQLNLSKIDTINIDFSDSYKGKGKQNIKAKFLKNYQSAKSVSLIILTNHKLYDKTTAKTFIDSFDRYLNALSPDYYPQHIRLDTMEEFISFFEIKDISKGITPLTDLKYYHQLKDEALSHNPDVSNKAFDKLYDLYMIAKLTLALIKNDPANAANILKTKQLTFL